MRQPKESKIFFFSHDIDPGLRDRKKLKDFIESVFRMEGKKLGSINYIFCSDSHILKLNRKFLNHNFYTDILTFDLSENQASINAEIIISIDRVRDNAMNLGVSIKSELLRVIFHGALHLCGYNDKKVSERLVMRLKEDHYLSKFLK